MEPQRWKEPRLFFFALPDLDLFLVQPNSTNNPTWSSTAA
jgi:hypothetical protein